MFILLPITLEKKKNLATPNAMWKFIYQKHLKAYLEAPFAKKNLEGLSIRDFEEIKDGQFPRGGHL
jgi:hypothetical protein